MDQLDLTTAGFSRVTAKLTGRPGYDPSDLLKLYIYGYVNRVRSSRRLEAETRRNIEVIWLLRQLQPDFKTIADSRRLNRSAFRQVFREFVMLCRQLDLFGRELLAVDGTRIKAVNNKDRNFTRGALTKFIREADEKLTDYMTRLDEGDAHEEKASGNNVSDGRGGDLAEKIASIKGKRDRHKALLDQLNKTGGEQISLTDPDARAMARMTKVGVGYNIQLAVDKAGKEQKCTIIVPVPEKTPRPRVLPCALSTPSRSFATSLDRGNYEQRLGLKLLENPPRFVFPNFRWWRYWLRSSNGTAFPG